MIFYNIGIRLMSAGIKIASLWKPKARKWVEGRRNIFERMEAVATKGANYVWVHAASLGEYEQGRPLIEEIRKRCPDAKILLTFFSPSGYEVRKNYKGADHIFYLPADTPRNVKRFIEIFHPHTAIFIKYEFWLNYLNALKRSGCHTYIVSAIFRRDSVFFRPYGVNFRRALGCFDHLFVQNEESLTLLHSIGIDCVTIAGDTRFDRVAAIAAAAKRIDIAERFTAGAERVLVAGSTWPPDEELLMPLLEAHTDMKFIVAPHEMDDERIDRMTERAGGVRYTRIGESDDLSECRLLVVDTIGLLSSLYRYGQFAYIGGGFGAGIHNTLEAAAFAIPVAFGPKYGKFKEAKDLIEAGAAKGVSSYEELERWLTNLIDNSEAYGQCCGSAKRYVESNLGATDKIVSLILEQ